MKVRALNSLLALSLVLLGCERPPERVDSAVSSLSDRSHALTQRAPQDEAQEKIRRKEYQVYTAMGYSDYYPGIDALIGKYVEGRYSSIMLEDTSDAIKSDDHKSYVEAATYFASEFNQEMISKMKELGLIPEPIVVHKVTNGFSIDGTILEKTEDVTNLIMKNTNGDNLVPVVVSDAGMKSDDINQIFGSLTKAGYHNVLIRK